MAKKKSFNNLNPTGQNKVKKASDEKIEEVLGAEEEQPVTKKKPVRKKQALIQFNIKLPENIYNALDDKASRTGVSKKHIVIQALLKELELNV